MNASKALARKAVSWQDIADAGLSAARSYKSGLAIGAKLTRRYGQFQTKTQEKILQNQTNLTHTLAKLESCNTVEVPKK